MAENTPTEDRIRDAIANPQNMGEMSDADSVGTVGSADCGDMVRMWLKFSEKDGKKVIDRASFQSFGCQTAIAVASVATELLAGKTVDEARQLNSAELSEPLGALPPMKIHCGQMVEGALRAALDGGSEASAAPTGPGAGASTLMDSFNPVAGGSIDAPAKAGKLRVVKLT
jgi:NifU-like protein involved in Fe-S cluster formation